MRAVRAEAVLKDRPISKDAIEEAAKAASAECRPIDDYRASAAYRRDMVYVLTRRALEQVLVPGGAEGCKAQNESRSDWS
jgi:carbon-monoxide dehydrogenase medium subunit